jgi:hypothetical protein
MEKDSSGFLFCSSSIEMAGNHHRLTELYSLLKFWRQPSFFCSAVDFFLSLEILRLEDVLIVLTFSGTSCRDFDRRSITLDVRTV